jgi:two-component system chemotaxis response regulator CheY
MSKGRVLVVDDDEDIRIAIEMTLSLRGYDVTGAGDGADALDLLHAGPAPAVILLDLRMPRMNGFEFLYALRGDQTLPRIPVVVLTGDSNAAFEARSSGADAVLMKPLETSALVRSIAQFVP